MSKEKYVTELDSVLVNKMMSICATTNYSIAIERALTKCVEEHEEKNGEITPFVESLSNIEVDVDEQGNTLLK